MADKGSWATITGALSLKVGEGRPAGSWTRFCCPAHEGDGGHHKPSLGVKYDSAKQRTVVHCFAGCSDEAVLDAIGLRVRDMFDRKLEPGKKRPTPIPQQRTLSVADRAIAAAGLPPLERKGPKVADKLGEQLTAWKTVAQYLYRHADGTVAGKVIRREATFAKGRDKDFRQRKATATGWEYTAFDKIPYRLPELLDAIAAGRTIYLVEGEKDADNGAAAGADTTTNAGGAAAWTAAHAQYLRGARRVVIVVDRDAAGYHRAVRVMATLVGLVGEIRVVEARTGKDLTNHLAAGHGFADLVPVPLLDPRTPFAPARQSGEAVNAPAIENTSTSITVYTKSDCVQCDATKNMLDRIGAPYRVVELEADPASRARLKELGFMAAPVVEAGEIRFAGFRPERLKALASNIRPEPPPLSQPSPQPQSTAESDAVDLDAVRQWAAPYLRSAQRRGDIPAVGSPAWVALPNGDPRKTGAIVQAALDQATAAAIAPAPARSAFDQVIQRSTNAAAAPLTPPVRTDASSQRALAAAPADHLAPARQHVPARTR
ncbi:glutaredoxin domain-containing protein [Nocardia camponoti]|uniref:Glutaredoxin domain-containing protein n=1 Tax=Nocardia camponoti TaxID=1616106 RepID=A0A917QUE4_9NOCA|nr:glutaredoxin domain-containing protein [Nocardia camponoti]GGK68956.1 hypothetical protein GCM10011591_46340 [Nocardia camponoti]